MIGLALLTLGSARLHLFPLDVCGDLNTQPAILAASELKDCIVDGEGQKGGNSIPWTSFSLSGNVKIDHCTFSNFVFTTSQASGHVLHINTDGDVYLTDSTFTDITGSNSQGQGDAVAVGGARRVLADHLTFAGLINMGALYGYADSTSASNSYHFLVSDTTVRSVSRPPDQRGIIGATFPYTRIDYTLFENCRYWALISTDQPTQTPDFIGLTVKDCSPFDPSYFFFLFVGYQVPQLLVTNSLIENSPIKYPSNTAWYFAGSTFKGGSAVTEAMDASSTKFFSVTNCSFSGFDVGVRATGGGTLSVCQSTFTDCLVSVRSNANWVSFVDCDFRDPRGSAIELSGGGEIQNPVVIVGCSFGSSTDTTTASITVGNQDRWLELSHSCFHHSYAISGESATKISVQEGVCFVGTTPIVGGQVLVGSATGQTDCSQCSTNHDPDAQHASACEGYYVPAPASLVPRPTIEGLAPDATDGPPQTPDQTPTGLPDPSPAETPEPSATETPEPSATETLEPTVTDSPVPSVSDTPVPSVTETPEPSVTETAEPSVTETLKPTASDSPVPSVTKTPEPSVSETAEPSVTETAEPSVTETPVPSVTETPVPSVTETPVPSVTETPVPSVTETPVPSVTETPVPSVTETPVPSVTDTPLPTAAQTPYSSLLQTPVASPAKTPESTPIPSSPATQSLVPVVPLDPGNGANANQNDASEGGLSAGMIGGIVAGIVAVAAALIAFFLLKRRKPDVPEDGEDVPELQESTSQDGTYDGDDGLFVSEYGLSDHAGDDVLDDDDPVDEPDDDGE
jgi:hypothetical protein